MEDQNPTQTFDKIEVDCPRCGAVNVCYASDYADDFAALMQCFSCYERFVIEFVWQAVLQNVYTLQKIDPSQGLLEVAQ